MEFLKGISLLLYHGEKIMNDHYLWCEKYRPHTIEDCILPQSLKDVFKQYIQVGELPHFLLCGTAGVGKTTVARALCDEIGAEYLFINGSDESGIDVLRTKIKSFASTVSLTDAKKIVIIDEADYLNCLDHNEKIQLSNGNTIALKDMVWGTTYDVVSFNIKTQNFESDVAELSNVLEKEVFEIVFENGNKIKCTDDHPLIVKFSDGTIGTRTIKEGLNDVEIVMK